jgi:RNA polymerase sigma-70 factor, ECF subfamily
MLMTEVSPNSFPNDLELLRRIEQRDQVALQLLYQRYSTLVFGLAYRVTGVQSLAEEATQDTFLKVWDQGSRWDPAKGKFSSWLLTVTRYTAIDRLRQEQRHNSTSIEHAPDTPSPIGNPHDPRLQDGRLLRELMTQIPSEQAELIEQAFFAGMTHQELADKLGLPLGTVKTRVRLGLQKLRALWIEAHEFNEDPVKDKSSH